MENDQLPNTPQQSPTQPATFTATPVQPEQVTPQISGQPAQSNTNTIITGSQLLPDKKPLPVGVYIIAGFIFVGFLASFADTSQNSLIYTIAMFADLLIAVGLIARISAARKILMVLSGIILLFSILSILMLIAIQHRLVELRSDYDAAIAKIDKTRITKNQQEQIDAMNAKIEAEEKKAGKVLTFAYIKLAVTAVGHLVIIVYLTRPKVKEAFHELPV